MTSWCDNVYDIIVSPTSHAGNTKWYEEEVVSSEDALRNLLSTMKNQGWQQWIGDMEKPLARILLEAATHGLCNFPIIRTAALACSHKITWQQLEADAVIELRLIGATLGAATRVISQCLGVSVCVWDCD